MGSYKWVISPLIWAISIVTLLITAHEPPNRAPGFGFLGFGVYIRLGSLSGFGFDFGLGMSARVSRFRGLGFRV